MERVRAVKKEDVYRENQHQHFASQQRLVQNPREAMTEAISFPSKKKTVKSRKNELWTLWSLCEGCDTINSRNNSVQETRI